MQPLTWFRFPCAARDSGGGSDYRVRVGSVCKGAVRFTFPPPKVARTHLAVQPRWGTETFETVPTSSSSTRRLLIGRQNLHFRADSDRLHLR